MASNTLIQNITEFYVATNGSILQIEGNQDFYPQSNYANTLYIYLEDGGGVSSATFINFTPATLRAYTSHWFYMSYEGIFQKIIDGEQSPRSFSRYSLRIPNIVLQNNNKNDIITNQITFLQRYGSKFLGGFATLTALNNEYDLSTVGEEYDEDLNVAYVIDTNKFYQVDYNDDTEVYEWVEITTISQYLDSKQYSVGDIFIQKGFGNAIGTQTIDSTTSAYIMQIISDLQQTILGAGLTNVVDKYTQSQVDALLSGKANTSHTHVKTDITDFAHTHDDIYYTETELDAGQLDNRYYTETELNNGQLDSRYYTESEVDTKFEEINLEYMKYEVYSETQFASVIRVEGKIYGVYNETTGVITWYYGNVGVEGE